MTWILNGSGNFAVLSCYKTIRGIHNHSFPCKSILCVKPQKSLVLLVESVSH